MSGIESYQQLKKFTNEKIITSEIPIYDWQFQANTIDLRLGPIAYRVRSSFISFSTSVEKKVNELLMYQLDLKEGAILEKGCVYIIPLLEKLFLPDHIYGKTNPKSSTGRLDIFTRIITDNNFKYNIIQNGYKGNLYVEVSPMSFGIKVRENDCLNQLRLIEGNDVRLSESELIDLYKKIPLLYDDEGCYLPVSEVTLNDGLFMRIDLLHSKENRIIGYKSKKNSSIIDLRKIAFYEKEQFWDAIYSNESQKLILEPEVFYIFASKERIVVPPGVCGEMIPYDPDSGEMRVHYAGFFDTGFGYTDSDYSKVTGAKAVLEIRPHDVPFLIEDGQILFRLVFDRNIIIPDKIYGKTLNSNYQYQGLSLSKHFI